MTKPSDFSPSEALEVRNRHDVAQSLRTRWILRAAGGVVLIAGWLAVAIPDIGGKMFVVDTVVFVAMTAFAFSATAASRRNAVNQEKKLRLRLLVHNMELENMSIRDELTQLFNRRYLMERLERELHTAKGFQRPLAFIAIEVESLSHVNGTYGYAAGDRLLAALGRFLLDYTRAADIPARIGGNKLGIILPDTSKRGAHVMIDRLTQALSATPNVGGIEQGFAAVLSFGTSGYPWGNDTVDAIVSEAETEMASGVHRSDSESDGSDDGGGSAGSGPAVFPKPARAKNGS